MYIVILHSPTVALFFTFYYWSLLYWQVLPWYVQSKDDSKAQKPAVVNEQVKVKSTSLVWLKTSKYKMCVPAETKVSNSSSNKVYISGVY